MNTPTAKFILVLQWKHSEQTSYVDVNFMSWNTGIYAAPIIKPIVIIAGAIYKYCVPYKYVSVGNPSNVIPDIKLENNGLWESYHLLNEM